MTDYRISGGDLRRKFIEFFQERGHARIGHTSLVPEHDPSALFVSAGMQPLVPYLLGQPHPAGTRLVNIQRCFRTTDIDEVGDTTHLTLFEMLGNWSLGDYFKGEMIPWSWEFLTGEQWLDIDPERLYVTVFAGDGEVPMDHESVQLWQEQFATVGMEAREGERIFPLGREDNWWGPVGRTGPCGPDTEMFYDTGLPLCGPGCCPGCDCGKFVEIWNDVLMEYDQRDDGRCVPLEHGNIDTGMGVARTLAVLNGLDSVYETDLLRPVVERVETACLSGAGGSQESVADSASRLRSVRIVADHVVSATHLIGDGIQPANVEQGYVLRRLIRRTLMHLRRLGVREVPWGELIAGVGAGYGEAYPVIEDEHGHVEAVLSEESEQFSRTLDKGMRQFRRLVESGKAGTSGCLAGADAFDLFATNGFPLEMTRDLAAEAGIEVDEEGFRREFERHQEVSRQGGQQRFAGGLADHSEATTRYHTATHLLHAALREVLGDHVGQRGSNITPQRLRFDFAHPGTVTPADLEEVERLVNEAIAADYPVVWTEASPDQAAAGGALGLFEERYGDQVRVYAVGSPDDSPRAQPGATTFSKEICGGPHVERTGQLGHFRIAKEQSASRGVRRIRAVLE